MKKKILAIIAMICIAAFALSACGGTSGGGNTGGGGGNDGGGGTSGGGSAQTFEVGSFNVAVPSGWTAFPQDDIFGDKDAEGKYPVDPDTIFIAKASDEFAALSAPSVRIYYYAPDAYILDSRGFYDNVEELSGVTVNGAECSAFSGESMGYTYQFVTYKTDDAQYEINILTAVDGKETGIDWQNADVKAIMESLKATK